MEPGDSKKAAVLQGKTTIPPVVFCTASGRPWAPERLQGIHRRVCALAGLRTIRIHDLRRTFATIQLYEHHAPIQYVSEQLGHASIQMTVNIYGHPVRARVPTWPIVSTTMAQRRTILQRWRN